ncbi:MAG: prenyltransferase, partial [Candidatus Stahlbacteria bacterium]|nr:prenyltransferase [Candidatus Stahlbacteria bacterium]
MRIKLWIRAMRAPFFVATAMPGILGAAMAWSREGRFSLTYLILTILGVAAINAGTNLANDYFDHHADWTGTDDINKENNPFGGGSHVIQEKLLSARSMLIGAFIAYAIAAIIGIYLVLKVGTFILVLGAIGILAGYFYTAPPFRFSYRGLGEIAVGIACGVLPVLGSYYVQVGKITMEVFIVSIPMGFLLANLLWLNQFPDYEADKIGG